MMQDEKTQENLLSRTTQRSPDSPILKTNKEQDRFLPIANVGRIMKKALPANGKISKDAKDSVQECVSEFISFVTGEASEKCQREKRKTINGDDIIWAITILDFEEYIAPLKLYLSKYRDTEGEKINNPKQQHRSEQGHQPPHQQNHYQFQEHEPNMSCNNNMFMSHHHPSPYETTDRHVLPLPFSTNSIRRQFQQQQDEIDSAGNW